MYNTDTFRFEGVKLLRQLNENSINNCNFF